MVSGARLIVLALGAFTVSGCLAKTAVSAVTLPVKVASRGVDLATTSQAEADQARGREIRRREERLGALQRDHERLARECRGGDQSACEKAQRVQAEIDAILPTVPYERD